MHLILNPKHRSVVYHRNTTHMTLHHHFKIYAYSVVLGLTLWLTGCDEADLTQLSTSQNLRLIGAYPLEVQEPSGLSLSKDKQSLWTVSDSDGHIFQIDLQGVTLSHFPSGYGDLEAITTIDEQHLAFIAERARKIVIAQKDGKILQAASIKIPGSDNQGPEALTYDEEAEQFHIMQETPGLLLTMNRQLEEVARQDLTFSQDYSSISFDSARKHFWVLSDQSKSIHVLDEDFAILEIFSVNIEQMEGIAIDLENHLIYLISDPLEALYVLEFDSF